ncbi:CHAT domain-containing protein [Myxococcota bacterium]|nr:CHAT domain-containing protein [Myxococcota bacterium]
MLPHRTAHRRLAPLGLALGLLSPTLCACGDRASPAPAADAASPVAAPAARLLGFRARQALTPGAAPLPVFDAESLPLLVLASSAPAPEGLRVRWDGAPQGVAPTVTVREDRWLVAVPAPASGFPDVETPDTLHLDLPGHTPSTLSFPVLRGPVPERRPALAALRARLEGQPPAAAVAAIEAELPTMRPADRLWASVERARRIAATGGPAAGAEAWRDAADEARAQGVATEVSRRLRAAAAHALRGRDLVGAGALLELAERAEGPDAAETNPAGLARLQVQRAYREKALGDLRRASELLAQATETAWATGQDADWASAAQPLATLLQDQGRHADALALMERVFVWYAAHPEAPNGGAVLANNHGWVLARAMAEGAIPFEAARPRALFEQARAHGEKTKDIVVEGIAFASLAQLALDAGDVGEATRVQQAWAARAPALRGYNALEQALLQARLHLMRGDPRAALAAFERCEADARAETAGRVSDTVLRARHGRGQALAALERLPEARVVYRGLLNDVRQLALHTDLQDDRSAFLARRHVLVEEAVAVALRGGEVGEAFDLADRGQAPALQTLADRGRRTPADAERDPATATAQAVVRGRWLEARDRVDETLRARLTAADAERPALDAELARRRETLSRAFDALATSAPGVPEGVASARAALRALGPRTGLVAFQRAGSSFRAFSARGPDDLVHHGPAALPVLLAEVAPRLRGLDRIYLVAGPAEAVRALARPGSPLAEAGRAVALVPYAAWLAAHPPSPRPASSPPAPEALIIADPAGNLPHARLEGQDVARRLSTDGRLAEHLAGGAATRAEVFTALRRGPRTFHFSGHGVLDATNPWEAHLGLAGGARLTVADVLALSPHIGTVVLSGCETGGAVPLSAHERLSLAEAFLLAGAETVVATTARIDDAAARRFFDAFHAAGGARRPAEALPAVRESLAAAGDAAAAQVGLAVVLFGRLP